MFNQLDVNLFLQHSDCHFFIPSSFPFLYSCQKGLEKFLKQAAVRKIFRLLFQNHLHMPTPYKSFAFQKDNFFSSAWPAITHHPDCCLANLKWSAPNGSFHLCTAAEVFLACPLPQHHSFKPILLTIVAIFPLI
ncbi:hypothetical protein [Heyndrickxia coagulans]|uniref:hypothetical protein n=1 Tax=Heyndrickxia coagulans TaxID=1398 RepID=UPI00128EECE7|nr:hypothetical protein [Heyndrickxia coagulans]